nr:cation transporting atpase worm [Hymenolepis microstoma]
MKYIDPSSEKCTCFITDADGSLSTVWAFRYTKLVTVRKWICYILTVFLLRLFLHWFPQLHIRFIMSSCSVESADKLLIRDSAGVYYIVNVLRKPQDLVEPVFSDIDLPTPNLLSNEDPIKYNTWIYYKNIKYTLDACCEEYRMLPTWDERPPGDILDAKPLTHDEVERRRSVYDENDIPIPRRTVGQLLLKEGLNQFYVFQVVSCIIWFCDTYYYYATAIIVISGISLFWNIFELRKNEKALHDTVTSYGEVNVCRNINGVQQYSSINSTGLVPGDIIEIPRDGCTIFCDAVLLQGNCIVNESTLTGESVPVTKIPFVGQSSPDGSPLLFELKGSSKSVLFCGTSVIQSRNFSDQKVVAVVVRTGFRTAKGEMVRAILFPKPMKFAFTRDANRFIGLLAIVAIGGFAFSVYLQLRNGLTATEILKKALDMITIAVPPALPMAMTVGMAFAQRRLKKKNIFCINPSVINVCGVINVACFDKTGTITEDGLDLWGVVPNGNGCYNPPVKQPSELPNGPLLETMATCHSLTRIEGELCGDPLDLKMFLSTNWEFTEEISEDHCKFEMTIPAVVRPRVSKSSENTVTTLAEADALPYEIGIIRQFPFSSSLQRMSVIARALNGSHFSVYTKGSPEMIETLCRKETLPRDFHKVLLEYTREGYRVLALAWRPLRVVYTRVMRLQRDSIERQLNFLGLLVMENRLKPESAPEIKLLKSANIRPVMVTGDNMLTALSVARDCEMIDEMDRIIIVSAMPPKNPTAAVLLENPNSVAFNSSNENVSDSDDSWKELVQFHYAEDLHKTVIEVTATSKRKIDEEKDTDEHSRDHKHVSGIRKFFHSLRRRRNTSGYSISAGDIDVESYDADSIKKAEQAKRSKGGVHGITLRMVDRPDFHLAITGKTWAIIRDNFPSLIPKLVVKGTVFARFSPDQKSQLIEALQSVGYFVSMCGDGANDCGALKAAHAGIALSLAEASVASPFTSALQNISCVSRLIREGRCALATSFGTFKFMIGYSITQFTSVLILYSVKSTLEDMQFLFIDLFVIMTLGITFAYTQPFKRLSKEPPTTRLVSTTTLLSLGSQLVLIMATQIGTFFYIHSQPWLSEEDTQTNTAIFLLSCYQYLILAVIFSKGPPYRQRIYTNYLFTGNILLILGINLFITLYEGQSLLDFFGLIVYPTYFMRIMIIQFALANFLLGYLIEALVEGVSFRLQMRELKKTLFPRSIAHKDYERIREEIDRMAGDWPPIIRSASIQDIRAEFFAEDHHQERTRHYSGDRLRGDSCSCSGDDEIKPNDHQLLNGITVNVNPTTTRKRCHSALHNRHRCRSLGASELRDLLKQCDQEEQAYKECVVDELGEAPDNASTEEGSAFKVSKKTVEKGIYRYRTKSSNVEQRKGPADAAKIPVLPLHNPGLS